MNSDQREDLRVSLLRFMADNPSARFGLPTKSLLTQARMEGRPRLAIEEIEAELLYLADSTVGYVQEVCKPLSPENRAWRITAKGRDFLAERGL